MKLVLSHIWNKPTKPGPYIARSASDKTDDWPFWYVSGPDGRTNYLTDLNGTKHPPLTPALTTKEIAVMVADMWNKGN